MPFGEPFFKALNIELSKEEQESLNESLNVKLQSIYGCPPRDYQSLEDFQICKDQFVALLKHIVALNPKKLQLYERYRLKVLALPIDTPAVADIDMTLGSTKRSYEKGLLNIENNHERVDGEALNSFIVDECYSGAHSNMDTALTLFTANSLDLLVANAKRDLLKAIAQDFLAEFHLNSILGNEVHEANGLFNHMAPFWGLSLDKEHLAINTYSADILNAFAQFAKQKMSVKAFMKSLKLLISPPYALISSEGCGLITMLVNPETMNTDGLKTLINNKASYALFDSKMFYIDRKIGGGFKITELHPTNIQQLEAVFPSKSNECKEASKDDLSQITSVTGHTREDNFKKLEDFFGLLGENGLNSEQLKHIYTEEESEDGYSVTLVPKAENEFNIFYSCLLASYLEKAGYLQNLRFTIAGSNLFHTGENLVEITKEGAFQCLTDEKIMGFLMSLSADKELAPLLYQQLSTQELLLFYKATREMDFFKILMEREDMAAIFQKMSPVELIHWYNTEEKASILAEFAYKNNWALGEFTLQYLVKYLPLNRQFHFFDKAILCNNAEQMMRLLKNNPELSQMIRISNYLPLHQAVFYDADKAISALHSNGWELNTTDARGNTAVLLAVYLGKMKSLRSLAMVGADVNQKNLHQGLSPMSVAVQRRQLEALTILQQFGANINENDSSNLAFTPLCHAVVTKQPDALERLLELGADPNKLVAQDCSAAWLAAEQDLPEFLSMLAAFEADLNKANVRGVSPAHIAAFKGNANAFAKLKELKADLDSLDNIGLPSVFTAARGGHMNIIEYLLDLPSTHRFSYSTTKEKLLYFSEMPESTPELKKRVMKIISKKITEENQSKILIYAKDLAFIMGHDEVVASIENYKKTQSNKSLKSPSKFFSLKRARSDDADNESRKLRKLPSSDDVFSLHKGYSDDGSGEKLKYIESFFALNKRDSDEGVNFVNQLSPS